MQRTNAPTGTGRRNRYSGNGTRCRHPTRTRRHEGRRRSELVGVELHIVALPLRKLDLRAGQAVRHVEHAFNGHCVGRHIDLPLFYGRLPGRSRPDILRGQVHRCRVFDPRDFVVETAETDCTAVEGRTRSHGRSRDRKAGTGESARTVRCRHCHDGVGTHFEVVFDDTERPRPIRKDTGLRVVQKVRNLVFIGDIRRVVIEKITHERAQVGKVHTSPVARRKSGGRPGKEPTAREAERPQYCLMTMQAAKFAVSASSAMPQTLPVVVPGTSISARPAVPIGPTRASPATVAAATLAEAT